VAGGDEIPGGWGSFFHTGEKKIPGRPGSLGGRDGTQTSGRDSSPVGQAVPAADGGSGTGHVVSPGKQAEFVRSETETGRDRIGTRSDSKRSLPRGLKTPISPRVTKTLRKTELKSVISLCLGAFVVKRPFRFGGTGHVVSSSRSRRIWSFAQPSQARSSAAGPRLREDRNWIAGARGPVCWWWGSVFT
jgi:hypothetical protein